MLRRWKRSIAQLLHLRTNAMSTSSAELQAEQVYRDWICIHVLNKWHKAATTARLRNHTDGPQAHRDHGSKNSAAEKEGKETEPDAQDGVLASIADGLNGEKAQNEW